MRNNKSLKKETSKTVFYFAKLVYLKKKSYYVSFILKILLTGFGPLLTIMLSRYLILYLTELNSQFFFITAGLLVLVNLIIGLCNNSISRHMDLVHNDLQLHFEEEIGKKTARLKYDILETSDFHNELEQAKIGISWYSGGIAGLANNINSFCAGVVTLLGTLTIISQLSFWVVLIILLSSIISIIATAAAQKRDANFRKRLVTVNRKLGYFLNIFKEECIAKDVRLYNGDELIESRVNEFLDTEWKLERNRTKFGNKIRVWIDVVNYLNQSFLYAYFAYQVIKKIIDISAFTMFLGAGVSFYNSIITITSQFIEIDKNAGFMKYYVNFMNLPERDSNCSKDIHIDTSNILIEFQNVSFKYPQSDVYSLKDVNLTIRGGQKIAIVGPNGAGKTTLVKLLSRLYTPTNGKILLNGKNIEEYNSDEYNQILSVVFQDYKTFAFTIRENLMSLNDDEALKSIGRVGLRQKLITLPDGLDTPISKAFDENGTNLSGGESQRLAIARSICKESPIMILDEPTASLDPVAEYEIFRIFTELVENKTAIFISHRMASCLLCDVITVIQDGTISAIGTHYELLKNNFLYKKMWEAQSQYYQ